MAHLVRAHFGLITNVGSIVPDHAFEDFLRDSIAPHFPGFTVTRTLGYWQGTSEPSILVEILTETPKTDRAIMETIGRTYCERFAQDAVLVYSCSLGDVAFVTSRRTAA